MAKKKGSEQIEEQYDIAKQSAQQTGEQLTQAQVDAMQQQVASMEAEDAILTQQENAALQQKQNANKDYLGMWADQLRDAQQRTQQEEQTHQQNTEIENKAAAWAGAGQLAASLVNLFAVGKGASNMQINDVSKDWMQQADRERRERRNRIENLRERQRGIQEKQAAIKNATTQDEYDTMLKNAQAQAKRRADIDKAKASIPVMQAQGNAETANTVTNLGIKGASAVADQQNTETRISRDQQQFDARMRSAGLNPDGTVNATLTRQLNAMKGGGSGNEKPIAYPILDANGNVNIAMLDPKQIEHIELTIESTIKDELGETQAKQFNKEFRTAATESERDAVLKKWVGKSATAEQMIRSIDSAYKGQHTAGSTTPAPAPAAEEKKEDGKPQVNPKTGLNYE